MIPNKQKEFLRKKTLFGFFLFASFAVNAQDTLKLSKAQCEAVFLSKNITILAERLEISKAEANVIQAKLWPNPNIGIDQVNFWASKKQLAVFGQDIQGFSGGNIGRNQEFSLSLEQLIITAGKRRNQIALEKIDLEKSKRNFEDILRNLKSSFRNLIFELHSLQSQRIILLQEIKSIQQLTLAYKKQVTENNISKGEYTRLKAQELEFLKSVNDLNVTINAVQGDLKVMMHIPSGTELIITDEGLHKNAETLNIMPLTVLIDSALHNRPDFLIAGLDQNYSQRLLKYEKSKRTPDIPLRAGYDRGGNFMYNFIGFGASIDIPLFNRNQGNIKLAKISIEQTQLWYDQKTQLIQNEVTLSYRNLLNSMQFLNNYDTEFEQLLDNSQRAYTKNFTERNISLLEYLDFLQTYIDNKNIIFTSRKELNENIEQLNNAVGKDVIQ